MTATNRFRWPGWIAQVFTIGVAAVGGFATAHAGIPAGWLSGAMFATAVLASTGVAVPFTNTVRRVALLGSGLAIGSAVTPDMLRGLVTWPVTLTIMTVAVAAATATGTRLLERLDGWSRPTAFFASVPGALSYVFLVASETENADIPRIAVVQVVRVFFLMGLVPIVVAETGAPLIPMNVGAIDPPITLLTLVIAGGAIGLLLDRFRVTAGMMFGAMFVAAGAHAGGFAPGRLPPAFTEAAQILVGAWVGARFIGFDWVLLRRSLAASLGAFVLAMAMTFVCSGLAVVLVGVPFAQALVAFAPGGLEAMSLLSIALGLDPLFVSAHHLARFILIAVTLPFILRWWVLGRERRTSVGIPSA